jgi:hypothetical protein
MGPPQFAEKHIIPNGFGVNINQPPNEEDIRLIREAGLHYARIDLTWEDIEQEKGVYDFTPFDRTVNLLRQEGITPYFILAYSNPLYEEDKSVVTLEGRFAFVKYALEALERYRGLHAFWEIWNEPNIEDFWSPQPSIEMYSYLVKSVAPIIKIKDPTGYVVAPAMSQINRTQRRWLEDLLRSNLLTYIDVLSVHPYPNGNPELIIEDYRQLEALVQRYASKPVPIISGEWGYTTDRIPELTQAQYAARMFLVNSMLKIPVSIWFNWEDQSFDGFGLYREDNTPKPSYQALTVLTQSLNGFRFSEKLSGTAPDQYALLFVNPVTGKKAAALWTTNNASTINIPFKSGSGQVVSMLGETRAISWEDRLIIDVTQSPVYLLIN